MKITKTTEVSVDVRKCSDKEKILVATYFKNLTGDDFYQINGYRDAQIISLNNGIKVSYSTSGEGLGITAISFKKFLRSVNPYKGETYYIDGADKAVMKRVKKMGYKRGFDLIHQEDLKVVAIQKDGGYFMHNHDCRGTDPPHISKKQFMNLKGGIPQEKPLTFEGHEVTVMEDKVKVGCRTIMKRDLVGFVNVLPILTGERIFYDKAYLFIKENKEKLNLT